MTQYKRIAIDTSKSVFTVHCIDAQDRPVLRTNLRRGQLLPFFRKLPATEIAIESCSGSHHWARDLTVLGHKPRLVPPQYVKPYVKRGKNDRNDAEAICKAAGRSGMHFAPVESLTQRAQGMVLKVRETLIGNAPLWATRYVVMPPNSASSPAKGISSIGPLLSAIEQEAAIPSEAKEMFALLGQQIEEIGTRIKEIDVKLNASHKASEVSTRPLGGAE